MAKVNDDVAGREVTDGGWVRRGALGKHVVSGTWRAVAMTDCDLAGCAHR